MSDYELSLPYGRGSASPVKNCIFRNPTSYIWPEMEGELKIEYNKMSFKNYLTNVCDLKLKKEAMDTFIAYPVTSPNLGSENKIKLKDEVSVVSSLSLSSEGMVSFMKKELRQIILYEFSNTVYSILSMLNPETKEEKEVYKELLSDVSELTFKAAQGTDYQTKKYLKYFITLTSKINENNSFPKKVDDILGEYTKGPNKLKNILSSLTTLVE